MYRKKGGKYTHEDDDTQDQPKINLTMRSPLGGKKGKERRKTQAGLGERLWQRRRRPRIQNSMQLKTNLSDMDSEADRER